MGRANSANRATNRQERDNIEAEPGFAASGTSQWERQAARGGRVDTGSIVDTSTMSRLELLIHKQTKNIINMTEKANSARDPERVAHWLKQIGIAKKFLDRLRAEQRR
ncbi:MAG: hypothetical protein ABSD31_21390 [Candidatus Binataceae bacterium]|jgi:hypothetical protein